MWWRDGLRAVHVMPWTIRPFLALARLAVTELFRQPACFLVILTGVACTILVPLAVSHQLGQQSHLATDSSLAFEFIFGIILAGYAACSTLHHECRSGTILVVFSKPVSRSMFFGAKFLAVSIVVFFFVACSGAASLLAERLAPRDFEFDTLGLRLVLATPLAAFLPAAILNFRTRRSFTFYGLVFLAITLWVWVIILGLFDRDGHRIAFGSMIEWKILPACLLEGLALLLMSTLALSLAGRLPAPSTVAILAVALFAGLISDHLATLLTPVPALHWGLRMILPDIQAFWPADRLSEGVGLSIPAMAHAAGYAFAYGAGILGFGYAAFRNRQF